MATVLPHWRWEEIGPKTCAPQLVIRGFAGPYEDAIEEMYRRTVEAGFRRKPATVDGPRTMVLAHRIEELCPLGKPVSS